MIVPMFAILLFNESTLAFRSFSAPDGSAVRLLVLSVPFVAIAAVALYSPSASVL